MLGKRTVLHVVAFAGLVFSASQTPVLAGSYTVREGDTLYRIAVQFGTTTTEMQKLNKLASPAVRVGQVLTVPDRKHTVKAGETLFSIARAYGTNVAELKRLNQLSEDAVKVGQVLSVPAAPEVAKATPAVKPSSASSKPATSTPTKPTTTEVTKPAVSKPVVAEVTKPPTSTKPINPSPAIKPAPATKPVADTSTKPTTAPTEPKPDPSKPAPKPAPTPSTDTRPVPFAPFSVAPRFRLIPANPAAELPDESTSINLSADNVPVQVVSSAPLPELPITPSSDATDTATPVPNEVLTPVVTDEPAQLLEYTVLPGDSLWKIGKQFGVSVETLRSTNSLTSDALWVGQTLKVPTSGSSTTTLPVTPSSPSANPGSSSNLRTVAERYLGVTYRFGGTSEDGLDCSGFVVIVFQELGVQLPRTSREQFKVGTPIEREDLREGDLVFFNTTGSGVSHVGIYLADDQFINAASNPGKVIVSSLTEKYWAERYLGARRVTNFQDASARP